MRINKFQMEIIKTSDVDCVFNGYPEPMQKKLMFLRNIIMEAASEIPDIKTIEETLKWGEPAYIVEGGSTIRIAWKKSAPDQYAMYFNCKTKLIDTFKEVYKETFKYEGNRAIVFYASDKVCVEELRHCIELALTYHARKNRPLLGV